MYIKTRCMPAVGRWVYGFWKSFFPMKSMCLLCVCVCVCVCVYVCVSPSTPKAINNYWRDVEWYGPYTIGLNKSYSFV